MIDWAYIYHIIVALVIYQGIIFVSSFIFGLVKGYRQEKKTPTYEDYLKYKENIDKEDE